MEANKILKGDCVRILKMEIKNESIDLIYADPPYNISEKKINLPKNKTGGPFYKVNEEWDIWGKEDYLKFTDKWIKGCWKILKNGGSFYISCNYQNIAEVITAAKKYGFKLNNIITWYKTNAMPNITKRTFTHATEYVCWFVKGKGWKFNYFEVKKANPFKTKEGKEKQMRDFIELPLVQGPERLRGKDGKALHPTQKPEKLLELIILASSNTGDLVLDPFFGTGTTGVVAKRLKRNWIGIENNKSYINLAQKRILETK